MIKEDIRDFQLSQLELLKYADKICSENHLKYFLVWGSALGAVRHQGFIPWDIDIDIAMYRKDYEEFLKVFRNITDDRVFLDTKESDPNHISPHAILRATGTHIIWGDRKQTNVKSRCDGIFIDIFPIDEVPESVSLQQKQIKQLNFISKLVYLKRGVCWKESSALRKMEKKAVALLLMPVSFHALNTYRDKIQKRYDGCDSGFIAMLTDPEYYPKQTFHSSVFGDGRMEKFEDGFFPVPAKAEEFLTIGYGNYMELPPEEKRYYNLDGIKTIDYGSYGDRLRLW